jgi:hypothetical protein
MPAKTPNVELSHSQTARRLGPLVLVHTKLEAVKGRPAHTFMLVCLPIPMAIIVQRTQAGRLRARLCGLT